MNGLFSYSEGKFPSPPYYRGGGTGNAFCTFVPNLPPAITVYQIISKLKLSPSAPDRKEALAIVYLSYERHLISSARIINAGKAFAQEEDRVHDFFCHLMRTDSFARYKCFYRESDRNENLQLEERRFQAYITVCFKNFCRSLIRSEKAEMRGGRSWFIPIQESGLILIDSRSRPDRELDTADTIGMLNKIFDLTDKELRSEYKRLGKLHLYSSLRKYMLHSASSNLRSLSIKFNMPTKVLSNEVTTLKRRFGKLFTKFYKEQNGHSAARDEIADLCLLVNER